jgi:NADPH:quinone reductase-like Zn-dependent oxidoreductase
MVRGRRDPGRGPTGLLSARPMRAVLLRRHGPPHVLRVEDVPDPVAGPGQVSVRLEAVGINYAEVLSRRGLYGWAPKMPYVLGMEGAGRIDGVGEGVTRAVGEAVVVGTKHGAYAERVVVPSAQARPTVPGFTVEEDAAFAVNWMTAWVSLMEMGRLRSTDRVLVSPAGGGVGTAAVRIAASAGCEVIALAGGEEKLTRIRELGVRETVNYRRPGWEARLAELARGRPIDLALEMVGGNVFPAVAQALAPFGRAVVAGYASLDYSLWKPWTWWSAWRGTPRMGLEQMYRRSIGLLSTHLGYLLEDEERMGRVWDDLVAFTVAHGLRPVVGHVLPFEDVAEAHRLLESRGTYGKVVLRLASPAGDLL